MVEIESSNPDLYYHMTAEEWKEKVRKINTVPWKPLYNIDPEIKLLHADGLYFLPKGKILLVDSKIIGVRCYICRRGWWGKPDRIAFLGLDTEVAFCQGCWKTYVGNKNVPIISRGKRR